AGAYGQAAPGPARPRPGRPRRPGEGAAQLRVHGRGGPREVRKAHAEAAAAGAGPDVPGHEAEHSADAGPGPLRDSRHGPGSQQDARRAGPGPDSRLQVLHGQVRPDVPAGNRDAGPAVGAPSAADGADAVPPPENVARGPRRARPDDGRAAPGRLAQARAGPPGWPDGVDAPALGPLRALSVLRRRADEPAAGDGRSEERRVGKEAGWG